MLKSNHRIFGKLTFLILIIVQLNSCTLLKKTNKNNVKTVVVIGAGISGLSAANYLKKKGFNPIVLEAQNNIGGRLKTNRSLGFAFDEGASWIHGPKRNPITKLAKKSKTQLFLTEDESVEVFDTNGEQYISTVLDFEESAYENKLEELEAGINSKLSIQLYRSNPELKKDRLWNYMLSAFLEFDTGGDIDELSSKYFYDDKAFKGEDLMVTNGYDKISNYLPEGLDIRLNHNVTKLDYTSDKVIINSSQGVFIADHVIVTVPLGVLKKKIIEFKPPITKPIKNAINNLQMGTVNKFILVWDQAFWKKDLQYIGYTSEQKGKYNYFLNVKKYSNVNALMTFSFGDISKREEYLSDQEIVDEIMVNIHRMFGPNIPRPKQILRTKWNNNPYAFGSYSFPAFGSSPEDFKAFEQSLNNKIFFAGEHTIHDYRGTVHGAYLSGIREAKKLVKLR